MPGHCCDIQLQTMGQPQSSTAALPTVPIAKSELSVLHVQTSTKMLRCWASSGRPAMSCAPARCCVTSSAGGRAWAAKSFRTTPSWAPAAHSFGSTMTRCKPQVDPTSLPPAVRPVELHTHMPGQHLQSACIGLCTATAAMAAELAGWHLC